MDRPTCESCAYWLSFEGKPPGSKNDGMCRADLPHTWEGTQKIDFCGRHPDFPVYLESLKKPTTHFCPKCQAVKPVEGKPFGPLCADCQDRTDHCLDCQELKPIKPSEVQGYMCKSCGGSFEGKSLNGYCAYCHHPGGHASD